MIGISVALGVGSLIGLYYMLIYINVVLQLELFGFADAEFPPDKIDIYYKYRTVYLVCGIIILLLFISLIVFNILMMTSKNNKNVIKFRKIYYILCGSTLLTILTNIFVVLGLDTNYQLVHRLVDFNNFYLPLIISGIFIIILLLVMQSFTKDKLKKIELVN
ncbi:MAG: hypothetical protein V8R16_06110 [Bacilli bacterium]